ncbi:uncharacterized protein BX664DRAFT_61962 [Halteromyces radiatus]|uniref:uncharacterized protein n=1 Tax=Halteromyces radiatus TaxID=101107 RepID=UPI00221EF147|nr:uncharacterized protein BX664DRAFT_61962 [Halteromyces radiatus]KAI8096591.1 hypothetical protein BX664DRAFT_61962 [Halteromyces radiatus]
MSVNRQHSLNRQNPPRALTLPTQYTQSSLLDDSSTSTYSGIDLSSYLPSTEESLQDWLTRNIPETSSPSPLSSMILETCPCCKKEDCEHMETLYKTIRKLESDTRLAAEIGQGLLHKHEALVAETNQTKGILEQQLNEYRDKTSTLEQLLVEADNLKQELMEQKDRLAWKLQRSQQALQDTTSDLEKASERCIEIGNELKNKTKEVEKLRIFKFMVRQADYREDALRSQLEDTNQELAISRKNELMLESKYKKLKSRYGNDLKWTNEKKIILLTLFVNTVTLIETICTTYEKVKLDKQSSVVELPKTDTTKNRQIEQLWESNEQLRSDINKVILYTYIH